MGDIKNEKYSVDYDVKEVNIKEFFRIILRRIWVIILVVIIAAIAGYYFSDKDYTPLYKSSTRVIIDSDENYMSTLMVMVKDTIVMEKVKEELNLTRSPESIANQIEISRINDSQVVLISVTDGDPKIAADIANQTARFFKKEIGNILEFRNIQLLSAAKVNDYPINKNTNKVVIISLIAGLIVGFGLVFLLDSLDDTVEKESDVENVLGVPVIGFISHMKSTRSYGTGKIEKNAKWGRG